MTAPLLLKGGPRSEMLLRTVKLCLRHSEIIRSADSEITAKAAVVTEYGSPAGCGILSPG